MKPTNALPAVLALALLAGCRDEATLPPDGAPGLHAVTAASALSGDTVQVTLGITRVEMTEEVASAQGLLSYDAGRMTFLDARSADGVLGAAHPTQAGGVRFAAAAVQGLTEQPFLVLRFVAPGGVPGNAVRVALDEATAADTFLDLTHRIVQPGARQTQTAD